MTMRLKHPPKHPLLISASIAVRAQSIQKGSPEGEPFDIALKAVILAKSLPIVDRDICCVELPARGLRPLGRLRRIGVDRLDGRERVGRYRCDRRRNAERLDVPAAERAAVDRCDGVLCAVVLNFSRNGEALQFESDICARRSCTDDSGVAVFCDNEDQSDLEAYLHAGTSYIYFRLPHRIPIGRQSRAAAHKAGDDVAYRRNVDAGEVDGGVPTDLVADQTGPRRRALSAHKQLGVVCAGEREIADRIAACRDIDVCEAGVHREREIAYLLEPFRQRQRFEVGAEERLLAYPLDSAGDADVGQEHLVLEQLVADLGDGVGLFVHGQRLGDGQLGQAAEEGELLRDRDRLSVAAQQIGDLVLRVQTVAIPFESEFAFVAACFACPTNIPIGNVERSYTGNCASECGLINRKIDGRGKSGEHIPAYFEILPLVGDEHRLDI